MTPKRIGQGTFWLGFGMLTAGVLLENAIALGQLGVLVMLGGGLAAGISVYMERRENG